MKKFISMFAFVAAIVFGAFALASCSDDDENGKHTFTYSAMLSSDNDATRQNPAFKQKQQSLEILSEIGKRTFTATDEEATTTWEAVKNQYRDKMLEEVVKLCDEFDDKKIYIEISINRDNVHWNALRCKFKE